MQAPPEGDPCGSRSHTKEALTKPSCPPSPCGVSMPSAEARGPGGSSAAAAPARTASCRGAIPPRPSAQQHMARLLRCPKRRRQELAGPASPRPPTRTGRQQPLGDLGTAPPPSEPWPRSCGSVRTCGRCRPTRPAATCGTGTCSSAATWSSASSPPRASVALCWSLARARSASRACCVAPRRCSASATSAPST